MFVTSEEREKAGLQVASSLSSKTALPPPPWHISEDKIYTLLRIFSVLNINVLGSGNAHREFIQSTFGTKQEN